MASTSSALRQVRRRRTAGRDAPIYDEAIKFIEQHNDGPVYMNVWGHVPSNRVDDKSVISVIDFLPTLCAITGVEINATEFDGEDAAAAWLGKGEHIRTRPLLWKTSSVHNEAGICEGQRKLIHPTRRNGAELALYDIVNDPGEKQNLVSRHPDSVEKLSARVDAWVATLPKEYIKTEDKDK